jgi:hypothetical protein
VRGSTGWPGGCLRRRPVGRVWDGRWPAGRRVRRGGCASRRVGVSQEFQVPDSFPAASGMPESGSGLPDIPAQNGSHPNEARGPGRPAVRGEAAAGDNPRPRESIARNDRSATAPVSLLDFLDRFTERIFAKNDRPWPAVFQIALLGLLLPASLVGLMMAAHAAGVPGWAIASGTATSAGGAGAAAWGRRRGAAARSAPAPSRRGGSRGGGGGGGGGASPRRGSHRRG